MTDPGDGMRGDGKRFRLGLVVGKFAPLHRGHLSLIEQAARQCDRLLILSYGKPELPRCPVDARRRWLAACCSAHECLVIDDAWLADACPRRGIAPRLIPPNAAEDAEHQAFLAALLRDVLRRSPDAMFASEPYVFPCARILGDALGRSVHPVLVDAERRAVPISATRIREAPAAHLDWLPAPVRADFVPRVVLLGGESTGKTTLARALAARLGCEWVAEYGRELWAERRGLLREEDMLSIAREQLRREDAAARRASAVLVCDTSPLTTLGYSLWTFGRADPALESLAQRRYDLAVLCAPDFPFVQDGTRRDALFRSGQDAWYRARLAAGETPWLEAGGRLAEREARILTHSSIAGWRGGAL